MGKSLDENGVLYLWNKIKEKFATKDVATQSANGLLSSTDKTKLDNISSNANNYSHPTYTPKSSGLYKITVDNTGHVSAVTNVAKDDITKLGIPAQDTTYSPATTDKDGLMSKEDKNSLFNVTECLKDINMFTVTPTVNEGAHHLFVEAAPGAYLLELEFPDNVAVQNLINTSLESYVKKTDVSNVYKYKGSVSTVADLPASGNSVGDTYNVSVSDMNYSWNGTAWDALGGTFTIEYLTNAEIDNLTK